MKSPQITRRGILWNTGIDGILIIAFTRHDQETWVYRVIEGKIPLTPEIRSKTPPYVDAQRGRDLYIKKALERQKVYSGSINDIMDSFNEFVLSMSSSMVDTYFKKLNTTKDEHKETEYTTKAKEILKNRDPIKYIMDTYNSIHKGDIETGKLLVISIGSQSVKNSKGIQPKLSGESGKGKTHACQTILHLVPEKHWIETSLSAKGLFYADIDPGTIIFSDDAEISEDLESTIKRSTTNFQKSTVHISVDTNRKSVKLNVPPRILWWLTSVDDDMGTQTINRLFGVSVDESSDMDEAVARFQLDKAESGEDEFPINEETLVCREIFNIVKSMFLRVVIPFANNIEWMDKKNRRNLPIFLDIIKSFSIFRFMQRDRVDDETIMSSINDFNDARDLYCSRGETQTTKLTEIELKTLRCIHQYGEVDSKMLQTALNVSRQRVSAILNGRDGKKGGLLSKVSGLRVHDISDKDGERTTRRKVYELVDFNLLENYMDIVRLRGNT